MREIYILIKETIRDWQEDKASRLAAALALYAILSIPPMLVLVVGIAGQAADEATAQQTIVSQVQRIMGAQAGEVITAILDAATQPEGLSLATVISLAVLFFSASGVFMQLQDALNTVWEVMPDPEQGFMMTIRKRLVSFIMVVCVGILLIVLLVVNSLLSLLGQLLNDMLPFSITWARLLNYGVSFLLVVGLIALVFKVIPDVKIAWRDVWVGSVVTAVLLALGVAGISLYMRYSDPTSSYGAAGSLIILMLWVYYSAQIIFLGAEFTQVYAHRRGAQIQPDESAVYMPRAQINQENEEVWQQ